MRFQKLWVLGVWSIEIDCVAAFGISKIIATEGRFGKGSILLD